jgi:hypothetical protein
LILTAPRHWLVAQGPIPIKEAVDDACVVADGNRSIVIVAHSRDEQQLSLINPTNVSLSLTELGCTSEQPSGGLCNRSEKTVEYSQERRSQCCSATVAAVDVCERRL